MTEGHAQMKRQPKLSLAVSIFCGLSFLDANSAFPDSGQIETAPSTAVTSQSRSQPEVPELRDSQQASSQFLSNSSLEQIHASIAAIQCGNSDVVVTSSCANDYCFNQNVAFINRTTHQALTLNYVHPVQKTAIISISMAKCLKSGASNYVLLEQHDGGNCTGCEWFDAFTSSGRYLGTSPGIVSDPGSGVTSDLPIRQKPLKRSLAKAIDVQYQRPTSSVNVMGN